VVILRSAPYCPPCSPPRLPFHTRSVEGNDFDTLLGVFRSSTLSPASFSPLRLIAANDDCTSRTLASCLAVRVAAGTKIFVAVSGYDGESGAASVRFSLSAS
jgi:hypothetical protein